MSRWRSSRRLPPRIVLRHALPNTVGPIVNAVALSLSTSSAASSSSETIFNYPGIAKLMVDAVATRDLPADPELRDDLLHRLSR